MEEKLGEMRAWYDAEKKVFNVELCSQCPRCLAGESQAHLCEPGCDAFTAVPRDAKWFICPRFIYMRSGKRWLCVHDLLGLIVPSVLLELTEELNRLEAS